MYHNHADLLAQAPRPTLTGTAFEEQLQSLAQRLLSSVLGLTTADKQFLRDLARDEARYPMRTLRRLIGLAAMSVRPEDREALAELVRAEILAQTQSAFCLATAFDHETEANGAADVAQRAYERERTRSTWEWCLSTLTRQMAATRQAIDAVRFTAFRVGARS